MATIYSRTELETKKKDELRIIVKNLGFKGRRLKAELIDLILENQSEVNPSTSSPPTPDSDSDCEHLLAAAALDVASAIKADGVSKKALERDSAAASDSEDNTSILDVDMLSENHFDSELSINKKHSGSSAENSLEEDAKEEVHSAVEAAPRPRLRRSNTFHLDPPSAATSNTTDTSAPPQSAPAAKGRPKRRRSVSPQPEEQTSQLGKRAQKKSRVTATVVATLPRRGRRGTVVLQSDMEPRDSSPAAPAVHHLPADGTTPESQAAGGRLQLRSNSSQFFLQNAPLAKGRTSVESPSKRTILTPKRTLKTPSRTSNAADTNLPKSKSVIRASPIASATQQPKASSPAINSPATVHNITPQISALKNSKPSLPVAVADNAVETSVSARKLSRAPSNVKPASALPSDESLLAVASPRLSAVSAQGRRLSNVKRLSSSFALSNRVVPTLAQPVFTIGKHDKKDQDKDSSQAGGQAKSSIPRFMAYAQKIHKMPNFKRIHEKAFNGMQNLDEFVSKKKQLSNSVHKAPRPSATFAPSVVSTKEMKLNFSDKSPALKFGAGVSTTGRQQTPRASVATIGRQQTPRASVTNKSSARLSSVTAAAAAATPRQSCGPKTFEKVLSTRKMVSSAAFAMSVKENLRPAGSPRVSLATPFKVAPRSAVHKTISSVTKIKNSQLDSDKPNSIPSGLHHRAAFQARAELHNSVKTNKGNASVDISAGVGATNNRPASKLPQYKPYKGPLRSPGTSRTALKNLANKRPAIASREERRYHNKEYIKGVRTNKRFQLQMERRGVAS